MIREMLNKVAAVATVGVVVCAAMTVRAEEAPRFRLRTLDGETVEGSIVGLDGEQIRVATDGGERAFAPNALLNMSPLASVTHESAKPGVWLTLADGSELVAASFASDAKVARVTLLDGSTIEFPIRSVHVVRFAEHDEEIARQWKEILERQHADDQLIVRREAALDHMGGIVRDVTDTTVNFELDSEVLKVRRTKVDGIIYRPQVSGDDPEPRCVVTVSDGSRAQAAELAIADGKLAVATPAGAKLSWPLTAVTMLDFSLGKIVYLSDLEPEHTNWTSYFGGAEQTPEMAAFFRPRRDVSASGQKLSVGGRTYVKGLGLHSRTELVYRLPGAYRSFETIVGIDDAVTPAGDANLVVEADGRQVFESRITGGKPVPVRVELEGARRLRILVDFGEQLDVSDHVDLCEARIVK